MANTLTGLIPTIYESLDVVARELVGFIPAVERNSTAERAALNQTIDVPITTPQSLVANTPAVTAPNSGDQTIGTTPMTISQSYGYPIRWNGEEQRGLINAGTYAGILQNQFTQAFRTLTNAIELGLWQTAYQGASRAYGTAGTAPFGTSGDLSALAQTRLILDNNGTPQSDLHLVLGGAAVANLRGKQALLLQVNTAGSDVLLRRGSITEVPLEGFDLHNSGQIGVITKGTGTSYVTSGSTPPGDNTITLATGSGTVLAGDIVTFAADTVNNYVVNAGVTAPGTITIGLPGAEVTIATANAMTIGANYTPNMAFHRSAIQLITRLPAAPVGPGGEAMDMADDSVTVVDPVSGIAFEIALYRQFMQLVYMVRLAWGYAAIKPNFIATLIG